VQAGFTSNQFQGFLLHAHKSCATKSSRSTLVVHEELYTSVTTCHPAASALHQLRRARDYSSPGRVGSTSTTRGPSLTTSPMSCDRMPRLLERLIVDNSAVRPITASRGATTHRLDCTGFTTPMLCIRTCRLAARLLVGRSHWLSPCVRSLHLAARPLVVRTAPALLRL
jgi:hypothetical protein